MRNPKPLPKKTSPAAALRRALQTMRPTGPEGFEGLVGMLLGQLLGETFVLAGSGFQPSGDGRNYGTISFQAKRYQKSQIKLTEIEGEISRNERYLPDLEVFVIAVTRDSSQLQDTIDAARQKYGLDIVVLDYATDDSYLPVLCMRYWEQAARFTGLSQLGPEVTDWISEQNQSAAFQERINNLQADLTQRLQTFRELEKRSQQFLQQRFGRKEGRPFCYAIDLPRAVSRSRIINQIQDWWSEGSEPGLCLVGAEGMGKSWTAAQGVELLQERCHPLVFWLDSMDWAGLHNLPDLFLKGLEKLGLGFAHPRQQQRILKKIETIWREQILLVLDGFNERDALDNAHHLLDQWLDLRPAPFRLLLTTRPLDKYPKFQKYVWKRIAKLAVTEYEDEELAAALAAQEPGLLAADLPPAILPLARIPKYLPTCVRLRKKLGSWESLSKEVVLYVDLLERIEATDPQIKDKLGWHSQEDTEDFLARLVRETDVSKLHPKFYDVKTDLEELRILRPGRPQLAVSPDHVMLGWAAYVRTLLILETGEQVREIASALGRHLEPEIPNDDLRTQALWVAFQLQACSQNEPDLSWTIRQATLLFMNHASNNSTLDSQHLEAALRMDARAYLSFLDAVFEEPGRTDQTRLIFPVARQWRDRTENTDAINEYLRRWLLLCWDEKQAGKSFVQAGRYKLPAARSEDHLRLSAIAVSILSFRVEPDFLPVLAIGESTQELSEKINPRPGERIKKLRENLRYLLRWAYTEKALPELERIAMQAKHEKDELLGQGARALAALYAMVNLPEILTVPQFQFPRRIERVLTMEEIIRNQGSLLAPSENFEEQMPPIEGQLAALTDLPDLCSEDRDEIRRRMDYISTRLHPNIGAAMTVLDSHLFSYWPWLAKYYPEDLAHCASLLRLAAFENEHPQWMISFLASVEQEANPDIVDEILRRCREYTERTVSNHPNLERYDEFTELNLQLGRCQEIKTWLELISRHLVLRQTIIMRPNASFASRRLRSEGLGEFAWEHCMTAKSCTTEDVSELAFWRYVAAWSCPPDQQRVEWLLTQLEIPELSFQEMLASCFLLRALSPTEWLAHLLKSRIVKEKHFKIILSELLYGSGQTLSLPADLQYETIMASLPKDFCGELFLKSGRKDDFDQWGEEMLKTILDVASHQLFPTGYDGQVHMELAEGKQQAAIELWPDRSSLLMTPLPNNIWGPKQNPGEIRENMLELQSDLQGKPNARRKRERQAFQAFVQSYSQQENLEIANFGGYDSLRRWAVAHPGQLLEKAEAYFGVIEGRPYKVQYLGRITEILLCLYAIFEPFKAYKQWKSIRRFPLRISMNGTRLFIAELWDLEYCHREEHREVRQRLLEEAENESELMMGVAAASAEGGGEELLALAKCFLRNDLATQRCLGVSILAWLEGDQARQLLEDVLKDPCQWVRDHAAWALRVHRQEQSCRILYQKALLSKDPIKASAFLQQMKTALSATASWWKDRLNYNFRQNLQENLRVHNLIEHFWEVNLYRIDQRRAEIAGRKLEEYYRGEKVDEFRMPFMFPWWDLNKPAGD